MNCWARNKNYPWPLTSNDPWVQVYRYSVIGSQTANSIGTHNKHLCFIAAARVSLFLEANSCRRVSDDTHLWNISLQHLLLAEGVKLRLVWGVGYQRANVRNAVRKAFLSNKKKDAQKGTNLFKSDEIRRLIWLHAVLNLNPQKRSLIFEKDHCYCTTKTELYIYSNV